MDWGSERYVRLFVRDTGTWLLLNWQARAVLPLLMRKVDRHGRLSVPTKARVEVVIAKAIDVPERVVKPGVDDLVEAGVVEIVEGGVLIVNFVPAQETPSKAIPGSVRTAEWRARKRETANKDVTTGDVGDERDEARHTRDECDPVLVPSVPSVPVGARAPAREPETRESRLAERAESVARLGERLTLTGEVPQPRARGQILGNLPVRSDDLAKLIDAGYAPDEIVATAAWLSDRISAGEASKDAWTAAVFFGRWHDSFRQRELPERFRANARSRGPVNPRTQDHSQENDF